MRLTRRWVLFWKVVFSASISYPFSHAPFPPTLPHLTTYLPTYSPIETHARRSKDTRLYHYFIHPSIDPSSHRLRIIRAAQTTCNDPVTTLFPQAALESHLTLPALRTTPSPPSFPLSIVRRPLPAARVRLSPQSRRPLQWSSVPTQNATLTSSNMSTRARPGTGAS